MQLVKDKSAVPDMSIAVTDKNDNYASGKTDKASYESSGVGDVHAKELKAKDVNLNHSGVGDITCSASGTIRIRAKGVGNVKYYGNPQVLSLSKSSVGAVIGK